MTQMNKFEDLKFRDRDDALYSKIFVLMDAREGLKQLS
jgi:hypothetical protein